MPKFKIRTRLIFLFTLQVLIIFFIGSFYLDWRLQQTLEDELGNKLESLAKAAASQIESELLQDLAPGDENSRTYLNLKHQLNNFMVQTDVRRVYVFNKNNLSLVDTKSSTSIGEKYIHLQFNQQEIQNVFSGQTATSTLFEGSDGKLYKTGFAPIVLNGAIVAGLAVEGSAQTLEAIKTVRRDLLILGLAVLICSVVLGYLFAKNITIPINRLELAAQHIGRGEYEREIRTKGSDEIGFLGQTMEEMRRAIVQRDTRQKAMLAGVAHEIRNPLGGIELFAGLLAGELQEESARKEAEKILKEVQNLKKIVQEFLDFARPSKPQKKRTVIRDVFDESMLLMGQELNGYEIRFYEDQRDQKAWVDPQHLKQIFLNLTKNSVEAMPRGGRITLKIVSKHQFTSLRFSDSGPGIPGDLRQRIFEPFFTGKDDGTGLGLAVVKSLVEENGGQIRLLAGDGAAFEILLPEEISF